MPERHQLTGVGVVVPFVETELLRIAWGWGADVEECLERDGSTGLRLGKSHGTLIEGSNGMCTLAGGCRVSPAVLRVGAVKRPAVPRF